LTPSIYVRYFPYRNTHTWTIFYYPKNRVLRSYAFLISGGSAMMAAPFFYTVEDQVLSKIPQSLTNTFHSTGCSVLGMMACRKRNSKASFRHG
jgi:hypothetical protein